MSDDDFSNTDEAAGFGAFLVVFLAGGFVVGHHVIAYAGTLVGQSGPLWQFTVAAVAMSVGGMVGGVLASEDDTPPDADDLETE
jgi:hypothetical protein